MEITVGAKSNIQGVCLLLRLQPVTLNRPRPPFSISAPLYPDHLASACHCILQSLDIKNREKNKYKSPNEASQKADVGAAQACSLLELSLCLICITEHAQKVMHSFGSFLAA